MNKDAALAPSSHQHLPSATAPSLVPIVRVGVATSNFGTYQPEADICEGFRDITRMHEKQGARSTRRFRDSSGHLAHAEAVRLAVSRRDNPSRRLAFAKVELWYR